MYFLCIHAQRKVVEIGFSFTMLPFKAKKTPKNVFLLFRFFRMVGSSKGTNSKQTVIMLFETLL